jgi:methylated-DNA-protein-cysteine methyltransferase-like protein
MPSEGNKHDSKFFKDVFEVTKLIPEGKFTTYGAIANYLGIGKSSRMVGWALTLSNKLGYFDVPAHRVLNRNGVLTGKHHFGHPDRMKELLEKEGIAIENDQVVNFDNHFWNPNKELL